MSYELDEAIERFKVNIIIYAGMISIGLFFSNLPRRYYEIEKGIYKIIAVI